jgi:hypothetical protein
MKGESSTKPSSPVAAGVALAVGPTAATGPVAAVLTAVVAPLTAPANQTMLPNRRVAEVSGFEFKRVTTRDGWTWLEGKTPFASPR